ncbi:MAG TPA: PH domain-containing protein [Acidimicrobiales bacterium]|nr:PH domain-containing protein [Acidimicrobiales bacterium]
MPFPRRLLNEEEDIVLDLHPHWWFFAPPLAALVGSIALGIVTWAAGPEGPWLQVPVGVLILFCLCWFGLRYVRWVTTNFVVTTDRLIYRHGVLSKHGTEIPLDRVNTVFFRQSVFERMVGSGDLVIESAGEMGRQAFSNVRHPSAVQNEIYRQIEANENRKFDRVGLSAAAGAAAAQRGEAGAHDGSIGDQIRELDELRKQGLITDQEFARKKQQLLDRM